MSAGPGLFNFPLEEPLQSRHAIEMQDGIQKQACIH